MEETEEALMWKRLKERYEKTGLPAGEWTKDGCAVYFENRKQWIAPFTGIPVRFGPEIEKIISEKLHDYLD